MLTAAVFVNHTFECSAIFTMEKLVEQRVCLKFCVSNEISCAESLKMLQKTYGESCMSKTQAYEWYKAFKEGREVVIDLPRSGRPSTSTNDENIDKIKKLVLKNRRMSLRELAQEVNISFKSVHNIMTDILGMKRVAARLVPKELNFDRTKPSLYKSFWPKTQRMSSTKHRTRLIWPRVTFSCSRS